MRIPVIPYIWRQLNGPQIKAVATAIIQFIENMFNPSIEYFSDFTISNMTDEQLTTVGVITQFSRPMTTFLPEGYFKFSSVEEYPSANGFDRGWLAPLGLEENTEYIRLLPAKYYRNMLNGFVSNDCDYISLRMLDAIAYSLREEFGTSTEAYNIGWVDRDNIPANRGVGDIVLSMGSGDTWEDVFVLRSALEGLIQNVFTPEPAVYIDFN